MREGLARGTATFTGGMQAGTKMVREGFASSVDWANMGRAKAVPGQASWKQKCIEDRLRIDFGPLLEARMVRKWSRMVPKWCPSGPRMVHKRFGGRLGSILEAETHPRGLEHLPPSVGWTDFGSKMVPKWSPKWSKIREKSIPKAA